MAVTCCRCGSDVKSMQDKCSCKKTDSVWDKWLKKYVKKYGSSTFYQEYQWKYK
jgi:hypothetical protein